VEEIVESILALAHAHPLKALLNEPFAISKGMKTARAQAARFNPALVRWLGCKPSSVSNGATWPISQRAGQRPSFPALVAAQLNVLIGNDDWCIADTIAAADEWMTTYGPVGNGMKAGGKHSPWREGEPMYEELDKYNNGDLPRVISRDDLE
jgi:hypothetical protein